jgi:hypothetical protein
VLIDAFLVRMTLAQAVLIRWARRPGRCRVGWIDCGRISISKARPWATIARGANSGETEFAEVAQPRNRGR